MSNSANCRHCNQSFTPASGPQGGRPALYCGPSCVREAASKRRREARHRRALIERRSGRPESYVKRDETAPVTLTYDAEWYANHPNGIGHFAADYRGGSVIMTDGSRKAVANVYRRDLTSFRIRNVWQPKTRQVIAASRVAE